MTPQTSGLDDALRYARSRSGWRLFPCDIVARDGKQIKQPMVKAWQDVASADPAQLAAWWGRWPGAMIGLAHRLSGTLALDIDAKPEASAALRLAEILEAGGLVDPARWLPDCPAFRSKSGGAQYIMQRPADLAGLSGNYVAAFGPHADLILGYSILPSGPATPGRRWLFDTINSPLAEAPDWIADYARARQDEAAALAILPAPPAPAYAGDMPAMRYVAQAVDWAVDEIRALADGGKQDGLKRIACRVGAAIAKAGALDLAAWAESCLVAAAPWCATTHERRTIRTGIEWGINHAA